MSKKKINITPIGDRVLIKPIDKKRESTTAQGIIIPEAASGESHEEGEVVATGNGKLDMNGKRVPVEVGVGDKVIYKKGYEAQEVKTEGEEYLLITEGDVLAIVK